MKQIFLDIQARIQTLYPEFTFIRMWNNQIEDMNDESGERQIYGIPTPALFVEFVAPNDVQQLGNGYQTFDPLIVNIHIIDDLYDAGDGTMEQNLRIFDIRDKVYKALNKFEATGCVAFVRSGEAQDFDHTNLYHFVQEYTTNYIDTQLDEPIGGTIASPAPGLNITPEIDLNI